MRRDHLERPDDPRTDERETQRLARDEYDRPRYGSSPSQPQLHQLRVHELMTHRVASVHPATSVERAARLMEEADCGALPVTGDNGVLVGMVTDRDIAIRIVARGRDARQAIVADCMTERVFACYAEESVVDCMREMARHQVRRMPIVDQRGRLAGMVAQSDLARHAAHHSAGAEGDEVARIVGAVSEPARTPYR